MHVRQFRGRNGAIYDAEMSSVASSHRIRTAFGAFYRRGSNGPPPAVAKLTVTNSLTFASRVRVRILKEIAKKHLAANADTDLSVFVTNYLPRPVLKLKEKKGPLFTYSYCEAVQKFSHHLTPDFLQLTTKFANQHIPRDELTSTFLVLSPDLLRSPNDSQTPTPSPSTALPSTAPCVLTQSNSSSGKRKRPSVLGRASTVPKRGRGKVVPPGRGLSTGAKRGGRPRGPIPMDLDQESQNTDTDRDDQETAPQPEAIVPIDFSQEVGAED